MLLSSPGGYHAVYSITEFCISLAQISSGFHYRLKKYLNVPQHPTSCIVCYTFLHVCFHFHFFSEVNPDIITILSMRVDESDSENRMILSRTHQMSMKIKRQTRLFLERNLY